MLLEALKEELFQLEVEHKQGKITQQEYEKAKPRWTARLSVRSSVGLRRSGPRQRKHGISRQKTRRLFWVRPRRLLPT